jgi:hypothetical protein
LELEQQAEELISDKNLEELAELKAEIEGSLAQDKSFALEMAYWSSVLKKIEEQSAKTRIEKVYSDFCRDNRDKIETGIQAAEAKKKAELKRTDGVGAAKKYENPFTALKIDNIKKAPTQGAGGDGI